MSWLPSPTWFAVIGGLCMAGAVASFFVPLIGSKIGLDLGVVGGVFLLLAACAHTYTARGEANVQAKFDAYKTAQAKQAEDIKAAQDAALAKSKAESDAALAKETERANGLNSQVAALQHRNVVLSRKLSDVLQQSGASTPGSDPGPKSGGEVAPPGADAAQTDTVCYDQQDIGKYVADYKAAYESADLAWGACVRDYNAIRAPTIRGASP